MRVSDTLPGQLESLRNKAAIVGAVGLVALLIGWVVDSHLFFRSYLLGYLFWMSITLGSLSLLMLHHMVGGGWGFVIRRILEAGTRTILIMGLLFIPILLGLGEIYEWAKPELVEADEILIHKSAYLNTTFFTVRAVIYFALWIFFAYFINLRSVQQDRTGDPGITRLLQLVSGPGLIMMGATVTFASVDWAMSLEPHWFSTLYGLLFLEGQALTTMTFAILMLRWLRNHEPLKTVVNSKHFHDLGNLLLAFVMLWAYLNFSQYLIVWSGNLPEEIPWYINRTQGGWQYLALLLIGLHFVLPFTLLLSRSTKTRGRTLAYLAGTLLLLRFFDLVFIIIPAFHEWHGFNIQWTDIAAALGIGGVWFATFCHKLKDRALLPIQDPRLEEAFGSEVLEHG